MVQAEERRGDRRFNKVFSVYITGAWGGALGIARNISENGMFIETNDPYPLGSRMQVTFSFPGYRTEMTVVGEVVHLCFYKPATAGSARRTITGMGIRFVGLLHTEETRRPAELLLFQ